MKEDGLRKIDVCYGCMKSMEELRKLVERMLYPNGKGCSAFDLVSDEEAHKMHEVLSEVHDNLFTQKTGPEIEAFIKETMEST